LQAVRRCYARRGKIKAKNLKVRAGLAKKAETLTSFKLKFGIVHAGNWPAEKCKKGDVDINTVARDVL